MQGDESISDPQILSFPACGITERDQNGAFVIRSSFSIKRPQPTEDKTTR